MANYAVRGAPRLDLSAYRTALSNLTPRNYTLFEEDPAAAYEWWLSIMRPYLSFRDDQSLRRIYDLLRTRFNAEVASTGVEQSGMRWVDWLGRQDPNRELARLPGELRGFDASAARFTRPVRFISF